MTTLKALQSKAGLNYPFTEDTCLTALIEQGLTGSEQYSIEYVEQVEKACAGLILALVTSADVTEGGYSVSLPNRDALIKVYNIYANKWGWPEYDDQPTITDKSFLW